MSRDQKSTPAGDPSDLCRSMAAVLDRIGDKWTVMVVGTLSKGPMRFNAMNRHIAAVSHRMLTLTLRGLERDGLVKRTVYPTIPPKVEYDLTDLGRSLVQPLDSLGDWAMRNRQAVEQARIVYDRTKDKNRSATRAGA
jgi:DNA-binding HxlR family transcriptional regulator